MILFRARCPSLASRLPGRQTRPGRHRPQCRRIPRRLRSRCSNYELGGNDHARKMLRCNALAGASEKERRHRPKRVNSCGKRCGISERESTVHDRPNRRLQSVYPRLDDPVSTSSRRLKGLLPRERAAKRPAITAKEKPDGENLRLAAHVRL
jgi:hypothetical protein